MAYSAYEHYKPTGIKTIGSIPEHWTVRRLKFMARIQNGKDYKEVVADDGFSVIGSGGEFAKANAYLYNGESVLLGRKGTIDRPLYINGPFWTVDTMFYTEVAADVSAKYLYYCALTINFLKYATSTALPSMTQQDLGAIPFALPKHDEQQAIARFLDFKTAQIDSLIAKKKALLDKLAEKRTALISHAVTKGLDSSVAMKDSGVPWLGKIPAHWDAKRLKFVVSTFGGGTPNTGKPEYWNGDIPWVSPKDMKSDFIEATEDYLTEIGVAESATKIVPVDSVLIVVRSGILRHTIPVARNTVEVSLNQDMKALVANERLRPGFIHWFISGLQEGLLPIWSKQGCTVESIEMDYMSNTVIPLPPVEEQDAILEKILEITSRLDAQAEKVTAVISSLIEYRSSLITHAVTGKIDVRDFQIPPPAEVQETL